MILRRLLRAAPAAFLLLAAAGNAAAGMSFTEDETALILAQGPWPVATGPDPSNRVSGNADAIAFGKLLFESTAISKGRDRACSACHREAEAFGDGLPRGIGIAKVDRNTPPLFNLLLNRWFAWDGKSDSLWAQSIPPILDPRELALTPGELRDRIAGTPELAAPYRKIFGTEPAKRAPEAMLADIGKALAAFQETIVSGKSDFDRFRDALEAGDRSRIAAYPDEAKRGLRLFVGRGQCVLCHFGPNFTSGEFHDIGLPHMPEPGRVDPGRYGGIKSLRENPFNLMGRYNDDQGRTTAGFTRHVHLIQRNWGEFRIPSLRNVALTAPYMHDGGKATLEDVVRHYNEIDESRLHQDGEKLLKPLHLSDAEIADLVAFLKTL